MKKILTIVSCLWASAAFADGLPTTPYIYVQGFAEERIAPDTLTVNFNVSATNMDQAKGKAAVSEKSAAVFKMFEELGITNDAITAFEISVRAEYNYADGNRDFIGYIVTRSFTVRLTDFLLYPKLVDGLLALRIESLREAQPSYSKADVESGKLKTAALADARKQANEIADTLSAKVASVYAASPIAFGDISWTIFGGNAGSGRGFLLTNSDAPGGGDTYVFEKLRLSQRLHVIFLIEPNKK